MYAIVSKDAPQLLLTSLLPLPSQVPPDFDGKPFEEAARLEDGEDAADERRGEDPDEGDDDPGGEEGAREDVVGEEHWDWDLQSNC
jgi:hypothetical protein